MTQQVQLKQKNTSVSPLMLKGSDVAGQERLLNAQSLCLLAHVCEAFSKDHAALLAQRIVRQERLDCGELPQFMKQTRAVRAGKWTANALHRQYTNRKVELKLDPRHLESAGAQTKQIDGVVIDYQTVMTWPERIAAMLRAMELTRGELAIGLAYHESQGIALTPNLACRTRPLDEIEGNVHLNEEGIPAALFDLTMHLFHNFRHQLLHGAMPHVEIDDIQSADEAYWWSKVLSFLENRFCLKPGTIKCTCKIASYSAVFEIEEVVHGLRNHVIALRSDINSFSLAYNESFIHQQDRQLPFDVLKDSRHPISDAYLRQIVKVAHRRGVLALTEMDTNNFQDEQDAIHHISHVIRLGYDGISISDETLLASTKSSIEQYIGEHNDNQLHITRDVDAPVAVSDLIKSQ
ncbi:hypothetical protein [Shewanella gelidii]|uniref:malate synthase n=1 Tax=Shewanella gelidii TaxID=1642821 RepID=A0A917JJQ5_9GAMM|nr:hypothetical protein [Shewanella gelidii]MCL1096533.1 hypothetical protein [Shewanella gelidii]GGI68143.1 malate synthase A [Shewanella gelidii]